MLTTGIGPTPLSGLSGTLQNQFSDWLDRRKPQEEKMLRAYQDNMRISRDDDTADTGMAKTQKARRGIFIGSTRGKIRSARAKLKDALFSNGGFPFDTKPTNEKLKPFAETMEAILNYQFEEGEAKQVLGQGINALATYGTGFIFGPFNRTRSKTQVEQVEEDGMARLQEKTFEYDCPVYEHARSMDVYPDPEAEDVSQGVGVYWASRKQPEFIRALKGRPGYSDAHIDSALTEKVSSYTDQGSDRTDQARANLYRYTREGRIWFVRYFGLVKKSELASWRGDGQADSKMMDSSLQSIAPAQTDQASDLEERVEAIVIMAGGQVIRAEENPYKEKKRPVRRCVYEDVEHEMWGVGIAENNDPHQRVTNAAFRLFIEGKAFALMPISSVDRSKFEVTEDFKLFPGKRYAFKPGLTADERKEAIIWHTIPDVTEGWEQVIALSEQFSDDDTAITKYTQGNDAQHLNKTAHGISMIMNAASLPLKEVLDNVDEMWIEEMVESLIDWNLEHLEPETVQMLLGDQHAAIWRQIKQYGKTNFMEWFATGSQTFVAKEILMTKLQGFMQIVFGSEVATAHTDVSKLLQLVWDAGQIGKGDESPVLTEEDMQKRQSSGVNAQAMEHIKEIEEKASELIKQANDKAQAAQQAATEAKRQEDYKLAQLNAQEKAADREARGKETEALHKVVQSSIDAHKKEAEIDKLQAETVKTLREASVVISSALLKAAGEQEGDDEEGEQAADGQPAKKRKKKDPIGELAKMHGQTLEALNTSMSAQAKTHADLMKAVMTPSEIAIVNGRKRVQKVQDNEGGRLNGV